MQERLQHFVAYVCASEKHVSHLLLGFGTLFLITLLQLGWLAVLQASNGKPGRQSKPFPAWGGKLGESLLSLFCSCADEEGVLCER